jgi:hypothetical protein
VSDNSTIPSELLWLKDAPLLIDKEALASYYDAVVRPAHREGDRVIKIGDTSKTNVDGKAGAKISAGLSGWLSSFIDAKSEASIEGHAGHEKGHAKEETVTLSPIETPERQLEQLVIFYAATIPERLLLVPDLSATDWRDTDTIARPPRALAFLDLPAGSKLIPTAAEFMKGEIVTFFDRLTAEDGAPPPAYPASRGAPDNYSQERRNYWKWYADHYSPQQGIKLIEDAAIQYGPINWIDYRIPINAEGDTLHIHVSGRGAYHTGTYAYYMMRRAYEFGLRLVGTLKVEPDMNVLAVYEK